MSSSTQGPIDDDGRFGIEIDFQPNSPDPARVYRSMTELIDACQAIDIKLAATFGFGITPVLLLEDIQTGSLTTFLRSMLDSVDDDALKSMEWKKWIGAYLVKAKHAAVDYLKERETIESSEELYDLQHVIADAARVAGALEVPGYTPLPVIEVAQCVLLLSSATAPLGPDDRAKYLSPDGRSEINTFFRVTSAQIEEVLTQRTIVNRVDLILKVKKPDFLGDSMWDFRHDNKKLTAKVDDLQWLKDFRDRKVTLYSGDALDVEAEETVKYGYDQEVLATHYKIVQVRAILPRS